MTRLVSPPAGPFLGDVEDSLIPLGTALRKSAFTFADQSERDVLDARIAEIRRLAPGFGILNHDGLPLLSAKRAREFADDYDDEGFRRALQMYANAVAQCEGGLRTKLMNGLVVACYERIPGEIWTWLPVRGWLSLNRDEDDPDALYRTGERLTGILIFAFSAVIASFLKPPQLPCDRDDRPTQEQVNSWMLAYYRNANEQGLPPPKRAEAAFPDCVAAINATDRQMKAAMQTIPNTLKRGRGIRDRR